MKMRFVVAAALASTVFAGAAHAQDWRTCAVTICSNGRCEGPDANLIIVAPADFADPGWGGEAAIMPQLAALAERLYPAAQGWSHQTECESAFDEEDAMNKGKAFIELAKAPPAVSEIKIANPFEIWKYTGKAAAAPVPSAAPTPIEKETVKKEEPAPRPAPRPRSAEPMRFLLYIGMREPIGGVNAICFSNIITYPAPEGYRGQWPTLKNALPIIQGYFPAFKAACEKRGAVEGSIGYMTDDASPAAALANMKATVAKWQGWRFPEVYISR